MQPKYSLEEIKHLRLRKLSYAGKSYFELTKQPLQHRNSMITPFYDLICDDIWDDFTDVVQVSYFVARKADVDNNNESTSSFSKPNMYHFFTHYLYLFGHFT